MYLAEQQLHQRNLPNGRSSKLVMHKASRRPRCEDRGSMDDVVEGGQCPCLGLPPRNPGNPVQDLPSRDQEDPRGPGLGSCEAQANGVHQEGRVDHGRHSAPDHRSLGSRVRTKRRALLICVCLLV